MSAQDEYGRHAYDDNRDEGSLKTEDEYGQPVSDEAATEQNVSFEQSDDVVQGETLLPVDAERSDEPLPPDTYGEPGDASYGEPRDTGYVDQADAGVGYADPVAEDAEVEDTVVQDSATDPSDELTSDEVASDDVVSDEVASDEVASDDVASDDVVVDEPVVAPVVDEPVTTVDDTTTDDTTTDDTTAAADEPSWQELKGLFVDDPAGAVAGAAAKVDAALSALRDKGASDSDTEHLRLAFRRYQELHQALTNT
jgi:hypothetical protein